jgi:hypothetical protein
VCWIKTNLATLHRYMDRFKLFKYYYFLLSETKKKAHQRPIKGPSKAHQRPIKGPSKAHQRNLKRLPHFPCRAWASGLDFTTQNGGGRPPSRTLCTGHQFLSKRTLVTREMKPRCPLVFQRFWNFSLPIFDSFDFEKAKRQGWFICPKPPRTSHTKKEKWSSVPGGNPTNQSNRVIYNILG